MAETTISAALRVAQWEDDYHKSYIRDSRFRPYMGSNENSIIQVKEDLVKRVGDALTINLIGALNASTAPNNGSTALVGNELALPNDGFKSTIAMCEMPS